MGLFIADNPLACFTNFFWSFFLAWILAMLPVAPWWALFLGLSVVFFHHAVPNFDFGATNITTRFFGGFLGTCDDVPDVQEWLFTVGFQFGGALVGAILYDWIFDEALIPEPATFLSKQEGKIFMLFGFANFIQAYALQKIDTNDRTITGALRLATAYMLSWVLCQEGFTGAIGGITIDVARLLGAKIVHGKKVPSTSTEFWWLLIVAPLAGYFICIFYQMLEKAINAKQAAAPKETEEAAEAPADNNAEENA